MQAVKINNITELKTRRGSEGVIIELLGYYNSGDGGGGSFYWNNTSTTTDNGGTIIQVTGVTTGRWIRNYSGGMNVKWFGVKGDGVFDNSTIFNGLLTSNTNSLYFPNGTYLFNSTLTIGNTSIIGEDKYKTILKKNFNGTFITLNTKSTLEGLYLDGNGVNFTGRGITITDNEGQQNILNCKITNFEDVCVHYTSLGGSQSSILNCEISRYNATTGSNKYAIVIGAGTNLTAVPRKISNVEFNGTPSIDFGNSSDTFVSNCFMSAIKYNDESRGVLLSNCRISNETALTFSGHNNTIVGCDIYPQITISSGTDNCVIANNSYNQLPIIDNSGNNRNQITHFTIAYTSTLSSGGTAPTLGNGTITSHYNRVGATTNVYIEFTMGSTTNLGSGALAFSLPISNRDAENKVVGGIGITIGSDFYSCVGVIPSLDNKIYLTRDTSSSITATSPGTFATGSLIRMSFSY